MTAQAGPVNPASGDTAKPQNTRSDHPSTVVTTPREPGDHPDPLERHPPTQRPNDETLSRRAPVPGATSRSPRATPTAGQRVTRPRSTVRHETGSSADQVGAQFAVQQVHQGFPVLGGRFWRPQVRLHLPDRAEDDGGGVLVDDA